MIYRACTHKIAIGNSDLINVRFSNRPSGVKHFQAIRHASVYVAHGLALLFGLGTKAKRLDEFRRLIGQLRAACNSCHEKYMKTN